VQLDPEWIDAIRHFSRRFGARWAVSEQDIEGFRWVAEALSRNILPQYDVIFGYAYAAIPPLLYCLQPFVPVELGTMRELPFEDSALGRLLALAYRAAPHVVITNPDVISAARQLGLENYSFVPHPVDEDVWTPSTPDDRRQLHRQHNAQYILVAPARQNWRLKGNDKYFSAVAELVKTGFDVKLLIPQWGQEVERSKALIRQLGIESRVVWLPPLPEPGLRELYRRCDLVLDQFGDCGTFGLITPKAMACGTPVLLNYSPAVHEWCYSEHPPLENVFTAKQIFDAISRLLSHPEQMAEAGRRNRDWILRNHSKGIIAERMAKIAEAVTDRDKTRGSGYSALKQKRLELGYEAACSEDYDQSYHGSVVTQAMDDSLVRTVRRHLDAAGVAEPAILDLGCGPGSLTGKLLTIPNVRLTGVDLSPAMIRLAQKKFPQVRFGVDDAEALSFPDASFDVVFCSGVLHHFPALDRTLAEISRVLKCGGVLVAREPNERNFAALFPEAAFAHLCLKYVLSRSLGWHRATEPDPPEFHHNFNLEDLPREVGKVFQVVELASATPVSYFYDMVTDPALTPPLLELDETLRDVPGLNVVVVARKGSTGVTPEVQQRIGQLQATRNVPAEHFGRLMTLAEQLFGVHGVPDWRDRGELRGFSSLYGPFLSRSVRVLAVRDHGPVPPWLNLLHMQEGLRRRWWSARMDVRSHGQALLRRVCRLLGRAAPRSTPPRPLRTKLELRWPAGVMPGDRRAFDLGWITIRRQFTADQLVLAMEAVRDHCPIHVEIARGAKLFGLRPEHQSRLDQLTVLRNQPTKTNGRLLLLGRNLYRPVDFYQAMAVALGKAAALASSEQKPAYDALIAQANAQLERHKDECGALKSMTPSRQVLAGLFT
jgi:ubiquinone/menaquinone biosynthesis C-methylase UbiE/glycosyltransferase involved in cell wall biosynthesis